MPERDTYVPLASPAGRPRRRRRGSPPAPQLGLDAAGPQWMLNRQGQFAHATMPTGADPFLQCLGRCPAKRRTPLARPRAMEALACGPRNQPLLATVAAHCSSVVPRGSVEAAPPPSMHERLLVAAALELKRTGGSPAAWHSMADVWYAAMASSKIDLLNYIMSTESADTASPHGTVPPSPSGGRATAL